MWVREKLALGVLISRCIFPKRETLFVKLVIFRLLLIYEKSFYGNYCLGNGSEYDGR